MGTCNDPRFIDPIVDINPVETPTGIAAVAPNSYIFGEYNNGHLIQLQLNTTGSVLSMTDLYVASAGIIAVELGPNNKLYFTTPDSIYTYNLPARPAANAADTTLVVLLIVAIVAVGVLMVYTGVRYRRRVMRMRERAGQASV